MTDEKTEPTPTDPVDFDLEAWVAGAVPAVDRVEVSSRAGLAAQLLDAVKAHEAASKKPGRAAAKRAEVADLDARIRELAEQLEGSWVEVEFRVPTPSERRKAFEGTTDDDVEQRVANILATVGRLRPVGAEKWESLEPAGWAQIIDVIGSGQFDNLMLKLNALTYTKGVTPGFSQRALSYLETRGSDRS